MNVKKAILFNHPIVMIGCGSVGQALLPLLREHIDTNGNHITVIDPTPLSTEILSEYAVKQLTLPILESNYVEILSKVITSGGLVINVAVDISSLDIIKWCQSNRSLYIDAGTDPWSGFYFATDRDSIVRTNYFLREQIINEKNRRYVNSPTAISCCGANPGMISWLLKDALLQLATDTETQISPPSTRLDWARLMQKLGVKGIHISERDTQTPNFMREPGTFVNTWSVDGFLSEGFQPAELGWGTHENWTPPNAARHGVNGEPAIFLKQPGLTTKVKTWCPSFGSQVGYLITHNESISIADYYSIKEDDHVTYRPTVHYAYHPCDAAILSIHETIGANHNPITRKVLGPSEIDSGFDELGVFLYGHKRNAMWYGSHLNIEAARALAPLQNATGLQVSSAMLAGIIWAIENPSRGIVEADEMDHVRCLEIQRPYLGTIRKTYTDWTPLQSQISILFPEHLDLTDAWQFRNIII